MIIIINQKNQRIKVRKKKDLINLIKLIHQIVKINNNLIYKFLIN